MKWLRISIPAIASWLAFASAGSAEPNSATQIPAAFIANYGQFDAEVAYVSSIPSGQLFVERSGDLVYALSDPAGPTGRRAVRESFSGGSPKLVAPPETNPASISYFVGAPDRWRKSVPAYGRVGFGEVWPGIEVDLVSKGNNVEKRFTVAAGAAVNDIVLTFEGLTGSDPISVAKDGRLIAVTSARTIQFTAPIAWQLVDGVRRSVSVGYRVDGASYGFVLGDFDPALPLVIDPLTAGIHVRASEPDNVQFNASAEHGSSPEPRAEKHRRRR